MIYQINFISVFTRLLPKHVARGPSYLPIFLLVNYKLDLASVASDKSADVRYCRFDHGPRRATAAVSAVRRGGNRNVLMGP